MTNKLVNGVLVPLTPQDIAARQVEEQQFHRTSIKKALDQYRWEKEVGGIEYLGKRIQTDRETRANWIGVLINAQNDPNYTVTWKTMDGFTTYNAQEAIGAALTASAHVQKCFKAEASIDPENYNSISDLKLAFDEAYNVS